MFGVMEKERRAPQGGAREYKVKNIVIGIGNVLFADAIGIALKGTADFRVKLASADDSESIAMTAEAVNADILLLDVSQRTGALLDDRLKMVAEIKKMLPNVKTAILCDSNSAPSVAASVKSAKQLGMIDAFFYESVTANYLVDAIDSL